MGKRVVEVNLMVYRPSCLLISDLMKEDDITWYFIFQVFHTLQQLGCIHVKNFFTNAQQKFVDPMILGKY